MHIIFFEGLGPFDCIRRQLIEPLSHKYTFTSQGFSYKDRGPKAPSGPFIVLGHSFGGDAAFSWLRRQDARASLFMTLDPRPIALIPELEMLRRPFIAPRNAAQSINFYQTFPLWGAQVRGAKNIKVSWGHTRVPGRPEPVRFLGDFLGDYGT